MADWREDRIPAELKRRATVGERAAAQREVVKAVRALRSDQTIRPRSEWESGGKHPIDLVSEGLEEAETQIESAIRKLSYGEEVKAGFSASPARIRDATKLLSGALREMQRAVQAAEAALDQGKVTETREEFEKVGRALEAVLAEATDEAGERAPAAMELLNESASACLEAERRLGLFTETVAQGKAELQTVRESVRRLRSVCPEVRSVFSASPAPLAKVPVYLAKAEDLLRREVKGTTAEELRQAVSDARKAAEYVGEARAVHKLAELLLLVADSLEAAETAAEEGSQWLDAGAQARAELAKCRAELKAANDAREGVSVSDQVVELFGAAGGAATGGSRKLDLGKPKRAEQEFREFQVKIQETSRALRDADLLPRAVESLERCDTAATAGIQKLADVEKAEEELGRAAQSLGMAAGSQRQIADLFLNHSLSNKVYDLMFDGLYVALASAMFSLLAFYIATAAYRAFRVQSGEAFLLMFAALLVMLGQIPHGVLLVDGLIHLLGIDLLFEAIGIEGLSITQIRLWILRTLNTAAFRGIALGAGIAGLSMAWRVWWSMEAGALLDEPGADEGGESGSSGGRD